MVSLRHYRAAREAARVLEGMLHCPPWLRAMSIETDGGVRIVVRVTDIREARMYLPFHINLVPIIVRAD